MAYDPVNSPVEHMLGWLDDYRATYHITHPGRLTTDELKALHDHLLTELGTLPDPYTLPPGATGLTLYSGQAGPGREEQSYVVAEAMSRATGGRQGYFADTVAGQVLNNRDVQDALRGVVGNRASYAVLMLGRDSGADRHVYGDHRLAVWDEVSRNFVKANPDLPVVPAAQATGVFARTEAGAYLEHNRGQPLNGHPHVQWQAVYDQGVAWGASHEQAQHQVAGAAVGQCAAGLRGVPVYQLDSGEHVVDVGPLVGQPPQAPPGAVRTTTMGERLDALRGGGPAPAVPAAGMTAGPAPPGPTSVVPAGGTRPVPTLSGDSVAPVAGGAPLDRHRARHRPGPAPTDLPVGMQHLGGAAAQERGRAAFQPGAGRSTGQGATRAPTAPRQPWTRRHPGHDR